MKCKKFKALMEWHEAIFDKMQKWVEPLFAFVLRLYIFNDFFFSGWIKVQDIYNGQWDRVVFLFKYEYKTPLLSPELAAGLGTFTEVVFPVLLVAGLFSRLSALAIFCTALLIELTYLHDTSHYLWMTMSMYLVLRGAGCLSADALIHKKCLSKEK